MAFGVKIGSSERIHRRFAEEEEKRRGQQTTEESDKRRVGKQSVLWGFLSCRFDFNFFDRNICDVVLPVFPSTRKNFLFCDVTHF